MKPFEIADGIYNVGVEDWNIRDFHGYSTNNGTTYNAFLIIDEKITLIDTVKKEFSSQLLNNISQIIDPKKIDYVISNHTEMDHSGSLPVVMHAIGEDKPVYCSKMGMKNLPLHFSREFNYKPVSTGEELSIGKRTLTFLETKMIHWPDSMFTYVKEDGILFSSDGFGQHYAGPEKFDDQIGEKIFIHAKKYYANILLLYSDKIQKLIGDVISMGLDIKTICPDHGIIWRKNPSSIINAYVEWTKQKSEKKAVVVYDSMWHSTELMAEMIVDGIANEGVEARPMNLRNWHRSDVMTAVMDAGAVVVGSPTLNNNIYPTVIDFLTYMKGLKPKDKIGAAFGSFGWSGESVKQINQELESMKFDIIDPGVKIKYIPDQDGLNSCFELGKKIGKAIINKNI
ncbi:MAG: FprA family A-type flavoprotein [Desulfobacterales bacterium]|jgi:flavorubredoxin|nr:FprA family A-type flavoprotein [Desulfobacteraceae bacterium]MBT4365196.1 FprA family A-type flavoprotein [Desulfobacteraceae bacterium]MBT7085502.1 FprA family A-type flavoprotein [Desulfobacterales bacterium]MBT7696005.1 FprA family A-type flavoprotein [Desulfobacterales bacterium]